MGLKVIASMKKVSGNIKTNILIRQLMRQRTMVIDFDHETLTVSYNPSHEDIIAMETFAAKFASSYPMGVTIIIPSSNEQNRHIAEVVMSKSKDADLLEGAICKITTEEVNDIVLAKDSHFRKAYGPDFNAAYKRLCSCFEAMDEQRNGTFSRHLIKDGNMRDVVMDTLKATPDRYAKDSKVINGRDILIIDDAIGKGQSAKDACKILMESYAPESMTVLTLLSKPD